ncbi:MAG: nitronate monooxygenase [Rhodoferax sp.]|jgi:nitronate monooxygenase|nr:nitronate monooxygenase [Rhodoferax sp.]
MSSALADLLGVRWPLIQAPMAGVQGSALALAVSGAGGLGSLPCAMLSPDALRAELQRIQAVEGAVVNVNFFCHTPPQPDPAREQHWRERLAPGYRSWGLDPAMAWPAASRAPFDAATAELLEAFRPRVVSFHFGLPAPALLARVRAWGGRILSSATTVAEGLWLQAQGVDAVIAQGLEAGGHRGMFLSEDLSTQLGTLALVPQLARQLRVPVIAAGGIADARGVAAAMALGASGVQVGTAYLLCPEAQTSALHRAALQSDAGAVTALTNVFTGRPARGIVNRAVRELGPIDPMAPAFPLASAGMAALRNRAEAAGSADFTPLWSGQNASGCRAVPAAELTRALAEGLGAATGR